jgi:hypothetical protein
MIMHGTGDSLLCKIKSESSDQMMGFDSFHVLGESRQSLGARKL